jgi:UDP-N-acetylmuramoyl-L-alanyl-D-glutamate--2,6-diaminopimelate ligase
VYPLHVPLIRAEDARETLARLAARLYDYPSKALQVIGITGTNGKTTTAYLLYHILAAAGRSPALIGTIQYVVGDRSVPAQRTTPEAPFVQEFAREAATKGCDCLIMEVSSHGLVQRRADCIDFYRAVFTNLGKEHLDYHKDMNGYFNAKRVLFDAARTKLAIVNRDDPWGRKLAKGIKTPLVTYGREDGVDVQATDIRHIPDGMSFTIRVSSERGLVRVPLIGIHNVYNVLAAVATAVTLDVPLEATVDALASVQPVSGRLEPVRIDVPYRVYIDYAHTAEALEQAIRAVREVTDGKILLVFGCGGDRDAKKRMPMGRVAARYADKSFITSDNPRSEDPAEIIREVVRGFNGYDTAHVSIADRRGAIAAALDEARSGDAVLIAGKGHECTQEIAHTLVPFSDRETVIRHIGGEDASVSDS